MSNKYVPATNNMTFSMRELAELVGQLQPGLSHWRIPFSQHPITACSAAQSSVKDDFSSKNKTLIFDCSPNPNPLSERHQTW